MATLAFDSAPARPTGLGYSPEERSTMTRLNTPRPPVDLTTLIALGKRAIGFLPDTAVHDAWREAGSRCSRVPDSVAGAVNTVATAVTSVVTASRETAASWRRHGRTDP